MRKKTTVSALTILLSFAFALYAQEEMKRPQMQEKLRETLQIRQQMRKIEREAIESDVELKAMEEEMKNLNARMREKLDAKLSGNGEYQELRKKSEDMREEWKSRNLERNMPALRQGFRMGEKRREPQ